MIKFKFLTILLLFISSLYSQESHEFFGVLKLNGDIKSMISYRLVFDESNGKIYGYSITDLDGEHETKNIIIGSYNKTTHELNFKEREILYTKSSISPSSFCFINFIGKVKLDDGNNKLEGKFKGQFDTGEVCINGDISLLGLAKIEKNVAKIQTKIDKTNRLDQATKDKVNPTKMLDSLKINKLNKDENLNVFWNSDDIKLAVWDAGQQDGDIINLYHNGKIILSKYKITNKKKYINVKFKEGKNTFQIEALNEGEITPNTSQIELEDSGRVFELMANIKQGEKTQITIIKKEPI